MVRRAALYLLPVAPLAGVAITMALLAAAAPPWAAKAQEPNTLTYNPGDCTLETGGRIFIRLVSGFHFAFPYQDVTYLTWTGEMEAPDLPVNEAEPEGCPDHPAIAAAFGVVWRPESATTEGPPPEPGWPVTLLQVPWHDGPVHVNRVNYRIVRGRSDRWEDLSEDVRVIRGAVVEGYQPHDGDTFLSSRPGTYPLAMGRPVVVYCLHAIYPGGRKFCTAAYGLTDGLSVIYKFRTPDVAERDVLRFDAHLRRFLARHQLTEEECAQLQTCGDRRWQPNM